MKKINIIGMPMKFGCPVEGADMSYDSLKDILDEKIENKTFIRIDTNIESDIHKEDKKIKYIKPVMEISNRLYDEVSKSLNDNNFPLIVGGDHSTAIGSVSASLDYTKGDLSVIWLDAHTDIHNDKTTPSGNIHGMPLSICIGRCDDRFKIGNYKLDPTNLYYIGVRNYEMEEITYINDNGCVCYMDFEVIERHIENVVKEIIKNIKTKYVHLSFDLDSICDKEFPAVNVNVEKKYVDGVGLTIIMIKKAISMILSELNVCSMDIVEYNPLLDTDGTCKEKVKDILEVVNNNIKRD